MLCGQESLPNRCKSPPIPKTVLKQVCTSTDVEQCCKAAGHRLSSNSVVNMDLKKVHFTKAQEVVRKDVERAFGVLQARFAMVRGPARFWDKNTLWYILTSAIIMHNMIIENERNEEVDYGYDQDGGEVLRPQEYQRRDPVLLEDFLKIHLEIEDKQAHERLRNDLVEHLRALHGAS